MAKESQETGWEMICEKIVKENVQPLIKAGPGLIFIWFLSLLL